VKTQVKTLYWNEYSILWHSILSSNDGSNVIIQITQNISNKNEYNVNATPCIHYLRNINKNCCQRTKKVFLVITRIIRKLKLYAKVEINKSYFDTHLIDGCIHTFFISIKKCLKFSKIYPLDKLKVYLSHRYINIKGAKYNENIIYSYLFVFGPFRTSNLLILRFSGTSGIRYLDIEAEVYHLCLSSRGFWASICLLC
jgi:hypothetical protein